MNLETNHKSNRFALKNKGVFVFLFYLMVFVLILFPGRHGIGNFWDWSFPYFSDQLKNLSWQNFFSWSGSNLGMPLGYQTDYFFRFLETGLGWIRIPAEYSLFIIICSSLATTAFGIFLIVSKTLKKGLFWPIIIGAVTTINSAILYKLVAGHLGYLVSLPVFVFLVYYVLFKFKTNFRSGVTLGLLLALCGTQIQFFVFTALFLIVYFIFNRDKLRLITLAPLVLLPILINLPWLTNYLFGVNNFSKVTSQAAAGAFNDLSTASLPYIVALIFSKATFIKYFFPKIAFGYFALFSLGTYALLIYSLVKKKLTKQSWLLVVLAIIFTVLNTGFFNRNGLLFSPMLREVGHFSPLVIMFLAITLAAVLPENRIFKKIIYGYLLIFIILSGYTINRYLPTTDYVAARSDFQVFEKFNQANPNSSRVLTYPFFGQYSFNRQPITIIKNQPVDNTGHDNFSLYANLDIINQYPNNVMDLKTTPQYKFLQNYDLNIWRDLGVRYIYDYSKIYQSNFNNYAPAEVYDNNLNIIKSDPNFITKIEQANPGQLTKVADGIYEIENSLPKIFADQGELVFQKINPTAYRIHLSGITTQTQLTFMENYHPGWKLINAPENISTLDSSCSQAGIWNSPKVVECQPTSGILSGAEFKTNQVVGEDSHQTVRDFANGWTINPDEGGSLDLILYFTPQDELLVSEIISYLMIIVAVVYLVAVNIFCKRKELENV